MKDIDLDIPTAAAGKVRYAHLSRHVTTMVQKKEEDAYDHIFDWYKEIWDWYGMTEQINLAASGTDKNPVADRKDLIKKAKEIGRNL